MPPGVARSGAGEGGGGSGGWPDQGGFSREGCSSISLTSDRRPLPPAKTKPMPMTAARQVIPPLHRLVSFTDCLTPTLDPWSDLVRRLRDAAPEERDRLVVAGSDSGDGATQGWVHNPRPGVS
ncbi:hypothetical protein Psi01_51300 [Planobispora siamensis]|uniref:Uncharacterized protein n=1 Tax=Planobispora siamensis TaxID=936338 RepID=A0A8J3SK08_9ACTN|nr:hypothetical protein Psi01_51300 [Planobispora siamensis]